MKILLIRRNLVDGAKISLGTKVTYFSYGIIRVKIVAIDAVIFTNTLIRLYI